MRALLPILGLLAGLHGVAQAADRVEAGKRVFARCLNCHEVGANARNVFGPQLNGVLGRRAGTAPGYSYSPAMKASRLVWNERNLAAFLRDTDDVVPGNKMRFFGFFSQRQLDDLMVYLRDNPAVAPAPARPAPAPRK